MLQAIVVAPGGGLTIVLDGEEFPEANVQSEMVTVPEVAFIRSVKPTAIPAFVASKAKGAPKPDAGT